MGDEASSGVVVGGTGARGPVEIDGHSPNLVPYIYVVLGNEHSSESAWGNLIEGVMVERSLDKIDYAELYFRNANTRFANSNLFIEGRQAGIAVGYTSGRMSYQGLFIMRRPVFEFSGSNRITYSGFGEAVALTGVAWRRVYENMTYSQIARQIAIKNKFGDDDIDISDTIELIPSIHQAGVSDYDFMVDLAERTGFDFFVFAGIFHFVVPVTKYMPEMLKIYALGGDAGWVRFTIEGEGQSSILQCSPVNPVTGEQVSVLSKLTSDNILEFSGGHEIQSEMLASGRLRFVDAVGNILSESDIQRRLDGIANRKKMVVKMSAMMRGRQDLEPRMLVNVIGVGNRFAGPYLITTVKHKIMGTEYTTFVEGVRGSTGKHMSMLSTEPSDSLGGTSEYGLRDVSVESAAEPT